MNIISNDFRSEHFYSASYLDTSTIRHHSKELANNGLTETKKPTVIAVIATVITALRIFLIIFLSKLPYPLRTSSLAVFELMSGATDKDYNPRRVAVKRLLDCEAKGIV